MNKLLENGKELNIWHKNLMNRTQLQQPWKVLIELN